MDFWAADYTLSCKIGEELEPEVVSTFNISKQAGVLHPGCVIVTVERVYRAIDQGRGVEFASPFKIMPLAIVLYDIKLLAVEADKLNSPVAYRVV